MAKIDFVLNKFPDSVYNKDINTNLYKILSSLSTELDIFLSEVDKVKGSHFIDYASGNDLDKIGSIINMQRFSYESDSNFRGRLKSKVPSFVGGGTINAIKQVIQIFLNVEPMIIEHYVPGDGHPYFDKGILNGFTVDILSGLNIKVRLGTGYTNGMRITSNDTNLTIPSNTTTYIKLDLGGIFTSSDDIVTDDQILIAEIITGLSSITQINDKRIILNPFEHFITNTASITIQIPYDFTEGAISIQDVKNVLKSTRAAGVAILIDVVGSYADSLEIDEGKIDFSFLVGFSGIGSSNFFGGQ